MKLKDLATGKIWKIDSVVANDGNGDLRAFYSGYDLIDDLADGSSASDIDQLKQEIRKNSIDINQQLHAIQALFSRVHELESKSNHRNL